MVIWAQTVVRGQRSEALSGRFDPLFGHAGLLWTIFSCDKVLKTQCLAWQGFIRVNSRWVICTQTVLRGQRSEALSGRFYPVFGLAGLLWDIFCCDNVQETQFLPWQGFICVAVSCVNCHEIVEWGHISETLSDRFEPFFGLAGLLCDISSCDKVKETQFHAWQGYVGWYQVGLSALKLW